MNTLDFLLQLAIILLAAKFLGLLMKKLGLPQVLGFILAGVLIGPSIWGAIFGNETFEGWLFPIQNTADSPLGTFAEIGVVLVMFSAGLEKGYSSRPAGPLFMLWRPCYVPPKLR